MRNIGIDARFYSPTATGIGRHVFEMIQNLAKIDKQNRYTVFLKKKDAKNFVSPSDNFQMEVADYPHYSLAEQTLFLKQLNNHDFDLMIFPHFNVPIFYKRKFLVTIHDLTIHFFPAKKSNFLKFWLYKKVIHYAAKNSVKILVVSENTQHDVEQVLGVPASKIAVVGNGVSDIFCNVGNFDKLAFLKQYNLPDKYFLYTGVFREHKNILNLVRGFAFFAKRNEKINLVLAGPIDDLYVPEIKSLVKDLGIENRVFWTGFFPESDFGKLFGSATAFVFPSFYEGFGVPPLEAMMCGIPTAVSNTSSLPEVCGNASLYFDPRSPEDIAVKMEEILNDAVREKLIEEGRRQAQEFSWDKVAEKYYEEILIAMR